MFPSFLMAKEKQAFAMVQKITPAMGLVFDLEHAPELA